MSLAREGFVNALSNAIDLKSTDESYSILNDNSSSHLDRINAVVTILNAAAEHATSGNLNKYLTYRLGNIAIVTSLANLAEQSANGEASWTDYMAALGAYVSRWPGIPSKLLGAIFSLYPLAEDLGEQWGRDGTLDPFFELFFKPYAPELYDFDAWTDEDPSSAFQNAELQGSPIAIDLDGDGIETTSQSEDIYFDHDKNGMAERTGWISPDDGLLVLDRNNDGVINNGGELFGDNTQLADGSDADNGYEALAELDSNGDGVINVDDTQFGDLRIWQDENGDGASQANELLSLDEVGIASLNTDYTNTDIDDGKGNTILQTSIATKTDGTQVDTADVWFGVNLTQTRELSQVEVSEDIQLLPNIKAFGNVHSLHQAMAKDPDLQHLVEQFVAASSDAERRNILKPLIYQWTGSTETDPNSRDNYGTVYMDARKLVTLESLIGREYHNKHGGNHIQGLQAANILDTEFQRFEAYVYSHLMVSIFYRAEFNLIKLSFDAETLDFKPDLSDFSAMLHDKLESQLDDEVINLLNILNGLDNYSTLFGNSVEELLQDPALEALSHYAVVILGRDEADSMSGDSGNDYLAANGGDDTLSGLDGDDALFGGVGNDSLAGDNGNDWLYGEAGDDSLSGGKGHDMLYGDQGNDSLFVSHIGNNILDGGDGNDTLAITRLNKHKTRNAVNAAKYSNTLIGGAGDDYLEGWTGSDTYLFNRGDGSDTIHDYDRGYDFKTLKSFDKTDRIQFGAGISQSDLHVVRDGDDLVITIQEAGSDVGDQIRIELAGTFTRHWIEELIFEDGSVLLAADLYELAKRVDGTDAADTLIGANLQDELHGHGGDDALEGYDGADYLSGGDGHDVLNSGEGDDLLYGGAGNDTLSADTGNDHLDGGSGDDSLSGGQGNDSLYGGQGNDSLLVSHSGNNILDGGDGNDSLVINRLNKYRTYNAVNAAKYSNTLIGGAGDDYLEGWTGSDSYIFNRGDGHDTILDYDRGYDSTTQKSYNKTDRIQLGETINIDDLWFSQAEEHLVISTLGTNDSITVEKWFTSSQYQIESIEVEGFSLSNNQVDGLVQAMAVFDIPSGSGGEMPQHVVDQLQPVLAASWQPTS